MKLRAEHLWVLVTLELSFILAASTPIVPPDIWWTLKAGEVAVQQGRPLIHEVFTFTPAEASSVNVQWLAQLALYGIHALGGLPLLILANALVALGLYGGLLWLCWWRAPSLRVACAVTFLAYLLGLSNLGARPQLLAYPLFLACYAILWRSAERPRWLWALPPLVAVWANVHGSFVLGAVLPGAFLAGHVLEQLPKGLGSTLGSGRTRALALTTLGAGAAMLVNPHGLEAVTYVAKLSSNPIIRDFVTEWEPTTIASWYGMVYFASVALALVAVRATRRYRHLTATEAILLLGFGYLGLASVRGIIWWGLVLAPILASQLLAVPRLRALEAEHRQRPTPRGAPALAAVAVAIALLAGVGSLPWLKETNPLLPPDKRVLVGPETPVAVTSFLRDQPSRQRIYAYQGWGGYFDWALWPRDQVFVDGRIEVHPPEVWFDYLYITFGRADWEALLDKYGVTQLVLSTTYQTDLIELARQSPRWRVVWEDGQAVVFGRSGG